MKTIKDVEVGQLVGPRSMDIAIVKIDEQGRKYYAYAYSLVTEKFGELVGVDDFYEDHLEVKE